MGKIIQLDDMLSNKIAAGEVVERPASVVKELVENAIDAHSTVIEIDVEEAGLQSIRVVDNGDGIEEEDVLTAFERHATSKIKDENDLFRIRTLGFRGEALPSIASVSYLEITTGTGEGAATRAVLEGGKVVRKEKASARKGTEVIVSNLFYNTPARLKYMKTIHTELGNITDTVNRLALAHPDVSIQLRHNGRVLLETNGNGDARQVLAAIYGLNTAKKMIPISARSIDFEIEGWISLPELTRASRNYISTIINGRYVKNYPLVKAIQEGYHTLLPIGRYPIALVMIQMDPLLVDVNVHPSKLEVRLSKEQELNELMMKTIQEAFRSKRLIPLENAAPKWKKEKLSSKVLNLTTCRNKRSPLSIQPFQFIVRLSLPTLMRNIKKRNVICLKTCWNKSSRSQRVLRILCENMMYKNPKRLWRPLTTLHWKRPRAVNVRAAFRHYIPSVKCMELIYWPKTN